MGFKAMEGCAPRRRDGGGGPARGLRQWEARVLPACAAARRDRGAAVVWVQADGGWSTVGGCAAG